MNICLLLADSEFPRPDLCGGNLDGIVPLIKVRFGLGAVSRLCVLTAFAPQLANFCFLLTTDPAFQRDEGIREEIPYLKHPSFAGKSDEWGIARAFS